MKNVLALILVLSLTSVVSATVIDVVTYDIGQSGGRLGASLGDLLYAGDIIGLKIILNHNPYAGYPSYDGYVTDGIDVGLAVTGPASLSVQTTLDKLGNPIADNVGSHASFGVWSQSGDNTVYSPMVVSNAIASMSGGVLSGLIKGQAGGTDLIWDMLLESTDAGIITIDLTLIAGRYADYSDITGNNPYPAGWVDLAEGDLGVGDLIIYSTDIPEPMTMALLGLGGLFLRRRK